MLQQQFYSSFSHLGHKQSKNSPHSQSLSLNVDDSESEYNLLSAFGVKTEKNVFKQAYLRFNRTSTVLH